MSEWISFKDGSPEDHIQMLDDGFFLVSDGVYTRQAKYFGDDIWVYPDYMKDLTHWMPLPKPVEEK